MIDARFRTGRPEGGRIKSNTAPSIRLRNEESSPTGTRRIGSEHDLGQCLATLGLRSTLAGHLADHPHRFSCIIGSAYDAYRFDGAQIRIAEVYQSTERTGPQGSMSDVFRVSTCSGEVVGSAIGETC